MFDVTQYYIDSKRINNTLHAVNSKDRDSYLTITKIQANWDKLASRVLFESVVCRQKRKLTEQYQRLHKEFKNCQEELEQAVTMYSLLNM